MEQAPSGRTGSPKAVVPEGLLGGKQRGFVSSGDSRPKPVMQQIEVLAQ
jgi:hypothetical protein